MPSLELKRRGAKLWGCCPLHGEKTPSFMVDTLKNRWKCFGCQMGGDQIDLVAKMTGQDNASTIQLLAGNLGITNDITPVVKHKQQKAIELSIIADGFIKQVNEAWTATAKLNRRADRILRAIKTEKDLQMPIVEWALKQQSILEGTLDLLGSEDPADQWMGLKWYRRILMNE